jgi:glyoxylase-like metal-dependent hydrolase (beta-lactamase superfamily II)/rhodanese-related sulfurtransferase
MEFELFVTPGLGDNSYLVWSGDEALMVDPQRDAWRFLQVAEKRGLSIQYVLETHVHNDYLTGAREIQAATGAAIAAPARGEYQFPHQGLRDGDVIELGMLRFVAIETPGHTPEHLSYLVLNGADPDPVAVFSGGSLIVGSAGRTDLLGEGRTDELTRAQFHSLRRLAGFGDDVQLLPTHGAGSFCASTAPSLRRTSTIRHERVANPALLASDEETFVRQQLEGLLAFPTYYRHMAPINRAGPDVLGSLPAIRAVSATDVDRLTRDGAWIVDARDRVAFADEHIPGAVNVEMNNTFASYVGWTIPFASQIVLVLPNEPPTPAVPQGGRETAAQELRTQLLRIGYDQLAGYLADGMDAWKSAGCPVTSYPVGEIDDLCRACLNGQAMKILDVRQQREWDQGHIPEKSLHVFVGDLSERLNELPRDTELWAICASGYRASTAASILDRAGLRVRLVARGGVPEWAAHCYPQAT